ncbi:MAG TPA: hypothetical protein VLW85_14840, partial [Myxococcales bacterium]|nr:hypothetical protein [Myxococcales bacterium]
RLRGEVDALLYVRALEEIGSPDDWYDLSSEPSEHELIALLGRSRARPPAASADVDIPCGSDALSGTLVVPAAARAAVIFAHTEAGSCICPRDLQVARALRNAGMATLLFEMLSPRESASDEAAGQLRSDIDVLAQRLVLAAEWVRDRPQTRGLRIGCFGANAGATAALTAAARRPGLLEALVCCRGRPDLVAASDLVRVRAPTLLLVGGRDLPGLELNRDAAQLLRVEHELSAVPHAAHLFEEPGVLEEVGNRSVAWFARAFEPAAAAA